MLPILEHVTMVWSLGGRHHLLAGQDSRDRCLPICTAKPEILRAWQTGYQALRVLQTGYQAFRALQTGYQALRALQTEYQVLQAWQNG